MVISGESARPRAIAPASASGFRLVMSYLQDLYPDDYSHCYGCGRLNADGLHVHSEWQGDHALARFMPAAYHIAMPGFVYGGLIASLVDCHAMATAAAASMMRDGLAPGRDATPRFVTASLNVVFLKPTPAGQELVLRGRPTDVGDRKVLVEVSLSAGGVDSVRGQVAAVRLPEKMAAAIASSFGT